MRKFLILFMFVFPLYANAQFGIISDAISKSKQKKIKRQKALLVQSYLRIDSVNGDTLSILRVPDNELNKYLDTYIFSYVSRLQKDLDRENKNYHENKKLAPDNIPGLLFELKSIGGNEQWDLSYYRREYARYKEVWDIQKKERQALENARKDSIRKVEAAIKEQQALEKNPFLYLSRAMEAVAPHRYFTIFYGIDVNFAMSKLSMFLQDDLMGLTPVDFKVVQSGLLEKFVPGISMEEEYLNVRYYLKEEGKYDNITRCEITGTADLVVRLYVSFWPQKIKLGGYKQGEIAHYEYLGDRVSLYGISQNLYKIEITSGNMKIDYYKSFHIK